MKRGRKKATAATDPQLQVYEYLIWYVEQHGYQPTLREMGEKFGVSGAAIQDRLEFLERFGLVALGGDFRAIRLPHWTFKRVKRHVRKNKNPEPQQDGAPASETPA